MIQVHERIEKTRVEKGVTKAFLAKKLGMTPMGYHYIAIGRNSISTNTLQVLADALGVPAEDFLRPDINKSVSDSSIA
jgi:transcriptional regulator with XRE-family HTH domain